MTGLVGIFLAIGAGWIVRGARQVAIAVLVPFGVILILQTSLLLLGYGVNPPDTATQTAYWVVQAVILGLTLGAADQIRRHRHDGSATGPSRLGRGLAVNGVLAATVVALDYLARPVLDPGNVATHTGNGQPPWAGLAGIAACAVVFVGLGGWTLVQRISRTMHKRTA